MVYTAMIRTDHIGICLFQYIQKSAHLRCVYPVITVYHTKIFSGSVLDAAISPSGTGSCIFL